ncbi:amino acid permease [Flavihumibacter fluvii]|uniref:amino acid permease n=1 Tax=Flavihumibacter fluvii TaxID=2838157 RepID=UPI001BDF3957|nr:amino acid permease [Flavihumibacter fluvii]ULQ53989.1 amino acid permease [Flavihumibacter fluvii]
MPMTAAKPLAKIGIWTCTSLVVGNTIASGIFLLPASLAAFGSISLLGWIGSSAGAIVLAMLFSKLSRMMPGALGGPYAYSRAGLGDFAGFLVAWGYWLSIWCTNAAIAVTMISYLSVFFPALASNSFIAVGTGLAVIWFLSWVNTRGVKTAGVVQLITTILKITPLILVSFAGLFYIKIENFIPVNISNSSNLSAITATASLTLFAFLGLESATIPSGHIENPGRTIPRATMIGTIVTIFIYVAGSVSIMGMIPAMELKNSNAPFADAAAIIWGNNARYWVAAGAIVSTFGALNGWILLQGQMPLAAARDKLFPAVFTRENSKGTPAAGIIISSVFISLLMLTNFTKGLTDTFTFMILMTTITVLVPYLFSATAYGILILQHKYWKKNGISNVILAALGFMFSMWAIVGCGQETVYWGFIAILAGIPFYAWMKRHHF